MGRVALATLVLAGLTASAGLAGTAPRWTAKGAITKLGAHAVTVNGKACRITPASPKLGLHVYFVGSTVKVVCADGVLLTIDLLHREANPGSSSSTSVSGQSVSSSSSSVSTGSGNSSASSLAIAGDFAITALGNGSIEVKGSSFTFSCTIGSGSPDVSGLHVGEHVSKMTCSDDVLKTLTPA